MADESETLGRLAAHRMALGMLFRAIARIDPKQQANIMSGLAAFALDRRTKGDADAEDEAVILAGLFAQS